MREIDVRNLTHFVTRMGMYITIEEEDSIVSFIHGYEIGTEQKCEFTKVLSKYVEDKYGIRRAALGWPWQIQELGNKNKENWVTNFKELTLEITSTLVSDEFREEYNRLTAKK